MDLEACLVEDIARRLLCYNPSASASCCTKEPLPVPTSEMKIPPLPKETKMNIKLSRLQMHGLTTGIYIDVDSDSEEFRNMDVSTTEKGFSI